MSNRLYDACLLCGGKGKRLLPMTNDLVPKSLVEIHGKKLIQFSLDKLDSLPISRVVFAVDHQSDALRQWAVQQQFVFPISFSQQAHPGILSALESASTLMAGKGAIVCNTDEMRLHLHLQSALDFHEASRGLATMVVAKSTNLSHHRVVEIDATGLVRSTSLKDARHLEHPKLSGLVNAGILIIEPQAFAHSNRLHDAGWSGIIDPLVAAGQLYAYVDKNIIYFNVGTEAEYHEAAGFLEQHTRNNQCRQCAA
jgi:NDP-sugar pyrophosphorylase family protein